MPHLLELTLFGTPEVRLNGHTVTGFRSSKTQALLYYLAVTGRPHTRATLTGLLWGDQPEAAARTSLSKCLSNLRELVGDTVLVERQTVAFNRDRPYHLDTEHFLTGVNQLPTPETIPALQTALTLYCGDFLEGFYVRDAPDFEQWLLVQRAHYREAVVQGLHTLANYAEHQGDLSQAITHTRRLLTLEPWREDAHRHLMTRLARSGQRAAALAQFETCCRILAEELAVEPDAATMALLEQIKNNELAVAAQRVSAGHFVNRQSEIVNPLPIPPTPLIGREREVAELGEMVGNRHGRLITITGPGGMGKTRLALAVATEQSEKFQHGAVFVPLAGVSSAQFLPQAILTARNVPLQGDLSPQQQVRTLLSNQECLLVLDNYEHLLPDVELLLDLLHYASNVTLLVTSRERLALQAEHLLEMTGLDYPPIQSTNGGAKAALNPLSYAAIQLFLQRVRQTKPRFTPSGDEIAAIVRICRISEGMPLALELTAAVVREQSMVALATALEQGQAILSARLRDLPERHRTMAAVFAHSWRLLSEDEQQVLAALSIFRGGFEREAAQEVASATSAILVALMDKSWLRCRPSGRYEMHELVRQYAHEQLAASGEFAAIQKRYIVYFLQLSEAASDGVVGRQQNEWMARIEQEFDNLRAVLKWFSVHAPDDGLGMILNLFWLWQSTSYLQEGHDWLAVTLAHPASVSLVLRAEAYDTAGFFDIMMNKAAEAEALFAQSFALYQQLDPTDRQVGKGLASLLSHQGLALLFRGDYPQAVQLCRQSLAIAQQIGDQWSIYSALSFMGQAFYHQDLFDEAKRIYAEGIVLCDALGNRRVGGRTLVRLGNIACAQGDLMQASTLFTKGLRVAAECHDLVGIGMALIGLASVAALCGDYHRAALLLAAKEKTAKTNPVVRFWPLERKENERTLAILHAHLDDAIFAAAWAEGAVLSLEEAVVYALAAPMHITGATGLTPAQIATFKALGVVEETTN